ncbi:GNAT family N-acetyltransferase [Ectothiorhodospira mobilis]|uniref:GNAT family N-acetyltransferase n=1 Tax=Ectothiorhodospira mobilis TaxID=195064 RepID=UPI0019053D0D|nr:GNAT family N-acetyltransferase [Ectothiorhodospira mobilis]MBK1690921.1 GNAT family N-acetyltransferase [Ectothiorhodospira mobilis]
MASAVVIEPLDQAQHDRAAFASGVPQVDRFLKKTANRLMKGGTARVFVMVDPERPEEILGFYSMNAHSVQCGDLPKRYRRFALADGSLPAAFIGMIGVAEHVQGQGIGSRLLVDALAGAYQASHRVGTAMVLLDILYCGNPKAVARRQRLYAGFGFQSLPSQPLRMFLPMDTIAQLLIQE